jgi:hypothetical protein
MSAEMPVPKRISRANVVVLLEREIGEIAGFIAAESDRDPKTVEAHLRWFLLENPARRDSDPLGFGLRFSDQLVGCILCVPQAFRFVDKRILLMGSSSFYVESRHRGYGGRIFLKFSRLANRLPLFGTSANAEAAALWKAAGASSIPHSDGEVFGVLHWPPVAEEFIHRRYANRALSRLAASSVSKLAGLLRPLKIDSDESNSVRPLASAEEVNDLPIHDPATKLTAMRDSPYIRWRYFSDRDPTVAAFAFRSHRPDHDVLVTVNQRIRGYRGQIKTLNVLDVYPEVPQEEWLRIVAALIGRYRKTVDAIVFRGQNVDQQKVLRSRGFHWRAFDAPTGWFLDKNGLPPTRDWYAVPADGDGLI